MAEENPYHKLSLKDRMKNQDYACVKMFANECMHWCVVVAVFAEVRLMPEGILQAETTCFLLLVRILYLLKTQSTTAADLSLLENLIVEHHRQFVALYHEACTIKPHWLLHLVPTARLFRVLLSCFALDLLLRFAA